MKTTPEAAFLRFCDSRWYWWVALVYVIGTVALIAWGLRPVKTTMTKKHLKEIIHAKRLQNAP